MPDIASGLEGMSDSRSMYCRLCQIKRKKGEKGQGKCSLTIYRSDLIHPPSTAIDPAVM